MFLFSCIVTKPCILSCFLVTVLHVFKNYDKVSITNVFLEVMLYFYSNNIYSVSTKNRANYL